jgi:hypothetical protein
MEKIEDGMHIFGMPAHGCQPPLRGRAQPIAGREPLSHEAARQALDPELMAPGPEPFAHEARRRTLDPEPRAPGHMLKVLGPERLVSGLVPQPLDPVALAHGRALLTHGPARQRRGTL